MDRTLKRVKAKYQKAFNEVGVNITTEQWVLLDALFQNDGISQNELANSSFKDAPTVSRIVDLLCKKGLTRRQRLHSDKRQYQLFLTDSGRATHKKAWPRVVQLREKGWAGLSDADYETFAKILNRVFTNFENL